MVHVQFYPLLFLDNVLSSVLALYTEDHTLPLPTQEEVLLCTCRTTTEEVHVHYSSDESLMRVTRRSRGTREYSRGVKLCSQVQSVLLAWVVMLLARANLLLAVVVIASRVIKLAAM